MIKVHNFHLQKLCILCHIEKAGITPTPQPLITRVKYVIPVNIFNFCFQYTFETLFRSLHFALMDNSCREYLFLTDFFMVSGTAALDLFNVVMGKTLSIFLVCC